MEMVAHIRTIRNFFVSSIILEMERHARSFSEWMKTLEEIEPAIPSEKSRSARKISFWDKIRLDMVIF